MVWLAVIAGGAFGTAARHGVNILFSQVFARPIPYATAAVNLIGAGVIGLLAGSLASGRIHMTMLSRSFVFVGVLGGFTTFSSFMLDTLSLNYSGEPGLAFANVLGQKVAHAARGLGLR